jgi:hypothetical protein
MNSLANKTVLVALALTLWGTSSMAATGEGSLVPVSPAEQRDQHSVTAATAPVPLFALTRLDAQSLAAQAMTDQELKAVEGTYSPSRPPAGPVPIPYPNTGMTTQTK